MLPTCATGTHAPAPSSEHATVTCCAVRDSIASIDFQLAAIVALAPTFDAEQAEASRATYRQAVARRKELVAANPHASIRRYHRSGAVPSSDRFVIDCACDRTFEATSWRAVDQLHTTHVRDASLHDSPCVCGTYDRCRGVRLEDARRVAHRGSTAAFRAMHRAYND